MALYKCIVNNQYNNRFYKKGGIYDLAGTPPSAWFTVLTQAHIDRIVTSETPVPAYRDADGDWHVRGVELALSKDSGHGVKVDVEDPTFPWRDLEGLVRPDPLGANAPALSSFIGGSVREYAFSATDKIDMNFHIPHDYFMGSDMYIHIHWGHNGATSITGDFTYTFYYTYAKGHNQANFATEKSQQVTYATTDLATTPRYRHRIDEIQITDDGGTGNYLDTGDIEPDGLLLANVTVDAVPTIVGGSPNEPFVFTVDLHYQSTSIGTKQKAPDFYV